MAIGFKLVVECAKTRQDTWWVARPPPPSTHELRNFFFWSGKKKAEKEEKEINKQTRQSNAIRLLTAVCCCDCLWYDGEMIPPLNEKEIKQIVQRARGRRKEYNNSVLRPPERQNINTSQYIFIYRSCHEENTSNYLRPVWDTILRTYYDTYYLQEAGRVSNKRGDVGERVESVCKQGERASDRYYLLLLVFLIVMWKEG